MSWYQRIANLLRSNRLSDEIDRELEFHVAERADELIASGMGKAQAQREARRRFGNYVIQKERTREMDLVGWLDTLLADVRYALRALRASPGFALVAILSLGLGIGANTAIFSLIDVVMLKHLPVRAPEELLRVSIDGDEDAIFTNPLWEGLRDQQDVFSSVFAYSGTSFNLASGGEERRVNANWVSGEYFTTLGVSPALGRLITRADDRRGCGGVAVLSHGFWQSEYGGSPDVIGRPVRLSGHNFEIIGVADRAFFGVEVGNAQQVYAPLCGRAIVAGSPDVLDHRSMWYLRVIGRPRPGLTPEQVGARLQALSSAAFAASVPGNHSAESQAEFLTRKFGVAEGAGGHSGLRRTYGKALVVLMVVVAIVLLIACANVANLLLARATSRQREMAIRLAIGAGRGRLMRQLLTESLLLSFLGACAGVAFAVWGSRLVLGLLSTDSEPIWLGLSVDLRILGFTTAVAVITGLLFGMAPAWRATRVQPHAVIQAHSRSIVRGDSRFGLGKVLVSAQMALCLVLVMGAALLLGTFGRLASADVGFEPERVLVASVNLSGVKIPVERRGPILEQILEEVRALPGVRAASVAGLTPISGSYWNEQIVVDGYTPTSREDALVMANEVSEGFFGTLGTTLLQGRDFDARDVPGSPRVAIVTESMARKFYGDKSAIGRHFRLKVGDRIDPPVEIVGIVEDMKYGTVREEPQPTAFFAIRQNAELGNYHSFALLSEGPPTSLIPAFEAVATAIDPRTSLQFVTLEQQVSESLTRERLLALLSGFFGALALLLATMGLYGVISYNIARRRNEIGIRIALGAARNGIVRMVLGEVTVIVVVGLVVGTALAFAVTGLVASFLFGVTPTDLTSLIASASILAGVALIAGGVPAARAARVEPMSALRDA